MHDFLRKLNDFNLKFTEIHQYPSTKPHHKNSPLESYRNTFTPLRCSEYCAPLSSSYDDCKLKMRTTPSANPTAKCKQSGDGCKAVTSTLPRVSSNTFSPRRRSQIITFSAAPTATKRPSVLSYVTNDTFTLLLAIKLKVPIE